MYAAKNHRSFLTTTATGAQINSASEAYEYLNNIKSSTNSPKLYYDSVEQHLVFGFMKNLKPQELRYEITSTAWGDLGNSEVIEYIIPTHPYYNFLMKIIPIVDLDGINHLQRNLNNILPSVSEKYSEQTKEYSKIL